MKLLINDRWHVWFYDWFIDPGPYVMVNRKGKKRTRPRRLYGRSCCVTYLWFVQLGDLMRFKQKRIGIILNCQHTQEWEATGEINGTGEEVMNDPVRSALIEQIAERIEFQIETKGRFFMNVEWRRAFRTVLNIHFHKIHVTIRPTKRLCSEPRTNRG